MGRSGVTKNSCYRLNNTHTTHRHGQIEKLFTTKRGKSVCQQRSIITTYIMITVLRFIGRLKFEKYNWVE